MLDLFAIVLSQSVCGRVSLLLFGPLLDDQRQRLLINGIAHGRASGTVAVLDQLVDVFDEHGVLIRVIDGSLVTAQVHLEHRVDGRTLFILPIARQKRRREMYQEVTRARLKFYSRLEGSRKKLEEIA